jgi:hypothetical protein
VGVQPWNLQSGDARYHRCWTGSDGNIHYSGSQNATNDWEFADVTATDEAVCSEGRIAYDHRGILHLLYTYTSTDTEVRERLSWDDGATWSDPTLAITNGTHPTISVSQNGTILRAAYVAGAITATRTSPNSLTGGTPFNFKDNAGVDLVVADDCFHLVEGYRLDAPWLLHVLIDGDTDTSDWISSNDGETWTRL